jgi:hypothetical protein
MPAQIQEPWLSFLRDTKKAMYHYGRFVELWKDCDPELRPLVDAAAERLGQLESIAGWVRALHRGLGLGTGGT